MGRTRAGNVRKIAGSDRGACGGAEEPVIIRTSSGAR
jgi:hypothetical protein